MQHLSVSLPQPVASLRLRYPKSSEEIEQINELLRKSQNTWDLFFKHLDKSQVDAVVETMFPVHKDAGENVIQQGDGVNTKEWYVIAEGASCLGEDGWLGVVRHPIGPRAQESATSSSRKDPIPPTSRRFEP